MQIVLEVIEGPHCGRKFRFDGHDNFIVGRAQCAHFRLPKKDRYFSRVHFMVEVNPPCCMLMDMGSTNGTRVNGQRVAAAYLADGDLIRGGHTVLRVSLIGESGEAVPKPPDEMQVPPPAAEPSTEGGGGPVPGVVPEVPAQGAPAERLAADRGPAVEEERPVDGMDSSRGISPEVSVEPPVAVPVADEEAPRIRGYQVVGLLGRGGMGEVFLATRQSDGCEVAVKTIHLAAGAPQRDVQRFLREANILRQLYHPNIVTFHELGRREEVLYFIMDYVRGVDAATLLERQGPLATGRAVRLVCQILEALDYAHQQGFVHRDIKPANLLVSGPPGREVCRLADFGLGRVYQATALSGITLLGDTGGTLPYMPPEQITHYRDASPAADQYSAAATLYRLLTGRHLFDFDKVPNPQRLKMILFDEPVPIQTRRPEIPAGLAAAIHRALEKEPAARFPDVATLGKFLGTFEDAE